MSDGSAKQLADQAAEELQRGRSSKALELIGQALALSSDDGEIHLLHGIALAQTGKKKEATEALRRATVLMPSSAKAFYNLSVHLGDQGQTDEAIAAAEEALRLDPSHANARAILKRMGRDPGEAEPEIKSAPVSPFSYRAGYEEGRVHTLPFLEEIERPWTVLGWVLVGLCALITVFMIVHRPFADLELTGGTKFGGGLPRRDAWSAFEIFYSITIGLSTVLYMVLDIIDRRARLIWIVPLTVCCLVAVPAVPIGLYMGVGRK